MTKLLYCTLLRPEDALETYTELLAYTKSAVTRNCESTQTHNCFVIDRLTNLTHRDSSDSEKSINNILDYVGGEGKGYGVQTDLKTLEQFYQVTKQSLEESKNEVTSSSSVHPDPTETIEVHRSAFALV